MDFIDFAYSLYNSLSYCKPRTFFRIFLLDDAYEAGRKMVIWVVTWLCSQDIVCQGTLLLIEEKSQ